MNHKNQNEPVVVAFAADDAYLPYLYVAAQSVVRHSSRTFQYIILVLYLGGDVARAEGYLAPLSKINVQVRIVEMQKGEMQDFYVSRHISMATYCRLYLPSLVPEYLRVLYLDCDILLLQDAAEAFYMPLQGAYLGACLDMSYDMSPDADIETECHQFSQYVNAGVVLFDLEAMRRDGIQKKMVECAAQKHMMHDQSVINIVCNGHMLILPEKWNFCLHNWPYSPIITAEARLRCETLLKSRDIGIVHYCSPRKPWAGNSLSPLSHLWWKEAEASPYIRQFRSRLSQKAKLVQFLLERASHSRCIMRMLYKLHR